MTEGSIVLIVLGFSLCLKFLAKDRRVHLLWLLTAPQTFMTKRFKVVKRTSLSIRTMASTKSAAISKTTWTTDLLSRIGERQIPAKPKK